MTGLADLKMAMLAALIVLASVLCGTGKTDLGRAGLVSDPALPITEQTRTG